MCSFYDDPTTYDKPSKRTRLAALIVKADARAQRRFRWSIEAFGKSDSEWNRRGELYSESERLFDRLAVLQSQTRKGTHV